MSFESARKTLEGLGSIVDFGSPTTPEVIGEVERHIGLTFPSDYREFLLTFGWLGIGHIEIFGLGPGIPNFLNIEHVILSERSLGDLPTSLIPIYNNGGGDLGCIKRDESEVSASIVVFRHDTRTIEVAFGSFLEFLYKTMSPYIETT